jgi:hypothetical protein
VAGAASLDEDAGGLGGVLESAGALVVGGGSVEAVD